MQSFYLNCWIPSKRNYTRVLELKMSQFDILSKYIANNDDENIANCFEDIIKENLENKDIYPELTKFDKWFILTFLRASSISPSLYFVAKDKNDAECNIEFNLFNILTELSEIEFDTIDPMNEGNISLVITPSRKLFTNDTVLDSVFSVKVDEETYYPELLSGRERRTLLSSIEGKLRTNISEHINKYEEKYVNTFLLKSNPGLQNFSSISLKLFDNTLYNFVVMVYKPFAKGIYKKKYNLMTGLKMSLAEVNNLTPVECDVYLGMLAADLKSSKESRKAFNT